MDKNTKALFEMLFTMVNGHIPDEAKALMKGNTFAKPSVHEVELYLKELNVLSPGENALKFWNFYEAKGWMIGKNKMKSWKSAIATWDFPKKGLIV